jgi:hypothetical protein
MLQFGIIMTLFGILYLIKPNVFRRGIWKETAITQRLFTPQRYTTYMRILGAIFVVAGIVLALAARK